MQGKELNTDQKVSPEVMICAHELPSFLLGLEFLICPGSNPDYWMSSSAFSSTDK